MQVILWESNFNTSLNILRVQLHFKWHGHFLLSPNLGLQQLFIGITDFKNFSLKPENHQERHLKSDFSNLHKKQTTKQLPLLEWSLVVWNHRSWGIDAHSVPISNTALIRAFSASLSEALRRSMSESTMRQHAPRLCDRCMKQSAVRYSTSKTTICSHHRHTFTQHTDAYVMCCLYKTTKNIKTHLKGLNDF